MAYATSKDGIHWDRSSLDIEPGTNQILTFDGYELTKMSGDITYLRPDSTTVWIDDHGPADERYKLFLRNPGGEYPDIVGGHIHNSTFHALDQFADRQSILPGELHDFHLCPIEFRFIENMSCSLIRQLFDERQMQKGRNPGNQVCCYRNDVQLGQ